MTESLHIGQPNESITTIAYSYNPLGRMTSLTARTSTSSYTYNGLGDRLSQTVDGVTINYTLDLNAGLTQVLADNGNTYLYGLSRLGQDSINKEYFLGDSLGSLRQMTDSAGELTLEKSYTPFGEMLRESGSGERPSSTSGISV